MSVLANAGLELALTTNVPVAVGEDITLFNVKLPRLIMYDVVELVSLAKLNVTLPKPLPDAIIAPLEVDIAPEPVVPLFAEYVRVPLVADAATVPTATPVAVLVNVRLPDDVSFKTNVVIGEEANTEVFDTPLAVAFVAFNVKLLPYITLTLVIAA